jgi:DNA-binding LytR/AlgR family response regulator
LYYTQPPCTEVTGVESSMNKILKKLPNSFIRIHRSNIVSLDRIDKIDVNILEVGGQIVKISKMYKNELLLKLGIVNYI